jgi:hypothetical protein
MPEEVDMLPSDRQDFLEELQRFLIASCLIPVKQHRQQDRIVGDYHIRNELPALVADRYIQVGAPDQFLLAADLRNH